jgi:lysophospholipase L1-like esterase
MLSREEFSLSLCVACRAVLLLLVALSAGPIWAGALPKGEDYFVLRGNLDNCRIRFERDKVGRVVFLGGSITENPGWRDMTCEYLTKRFPDTKFDFVNAGISSTGSTPGAFRLSRDVFARGPVDLLFEEAAVNDFVNGREPKQMARGMEGVLRQARRKNPKLDVVVMHFVDPWKMKDYRAGKTPVVIQRHEAVAKHYGATSIHLAREVTERIDAGQFTWKNDFRNLHPSPFGQRLYAATIRRMFDAAWAKSLAGDAKRVGHSMPKPLDRFGYDRARLAPVDKATDLNGFALVQRCDPSKTTRAGVRKRFTNVPMLVGTKPGDSFTLPFNGRAVGLFVTAGPDAGIIEYRIDDGPWKKKDLFTRWSRGLHLPMAHLLAEELDGKRHTLSVHIAGDRNPQSRGYACRVVHFLVNGPGKR